MEAALDDDFGEHILVLFVGDIMIYNSRALSISCGVFALHIRSEIGDAT